MGHTFPPFFWALAKTAVSTLMTEMAISHAWFVPQLRTSGKWWSWDSNHSLFFGDAWNPPKIKEAKVAKAEKDAKKPKKKQSTTKCINFFHQKKSSLSFSFLPTPANKKLPHPGKIANQKSCQPKKKRHQTKNSPVFFFNRNFPGLGKSRSSPPLLRAPGTNEFKVIWSAPLDSVNSWGGKKLIPV